MSRRTGPTYYLDADGSIARVPLANHPGRAATIDHADIQRLIAGGYRAAWFVNSNGKRNHYVRTLGREGDPTLVQVSRLVAGAGPREVVRHADGDHLNLTRRNLVVVPRAQRQPDRAA